MCMGCWDADKREEKIKMYGPDACLGEDMRTMLLSTMKSELTEEWLETNKTDFRVFKAAITDTQEEEFSWSVVNPKTQKASTLHVQFV